MKEIFSNKFVTVYYESKERYIQATFAGIVDLNLAKQMFQSLREFREENEVRGSIADISGVMGGYAKMVEYLSQYFEQVSKKGNRCTAVVVNDEDILTIRSTEKLMEVPLATELRMFSDLEKAENWVKQRVSGE